MAKDNNYTVVTSLPEGLKENFLETLEVNGVKNQGKRYLAADFLHASIKAMTEKPEEMIKFIGL